MDDDDDDDEERNPACFSLGILRQILDLSQNAAATRGATGGERSLPRKTPVRETPSR